MRLAELVERFREPFLAKYAARLSPAHLRALDAITACKTACGHFTCRCGQCQHTQSHLLSCGHRSCPRCQHGAASQWLARQQRKLIPAEYFMVTLTVPAQLRSLIYTHQHRTYALLFDAAIATLKQLGLDKRHLGGELGMTAVLHTHTRRLDYHPHLHVIIPAAYLTQRGTTFKRQDSQYLIHGDVIAKLFRGKLLYALIDEGFALPATLPKNWVVNVKHIGKGLPALQYLSRYLYRGVLSEKAITHADATDITFHYQDATTNRSTPRTLRGEDFIWRWLQHVLPTRFRRVRDFGFLHPNAKKKLTFIQYLLGVKSIPQPQPIKRAILCQQCCQQTSIIAVFPSRIPINFRFMKRVLNE